MKDIIMGVKVEYPDDMPKEEAKEYVRLELQKFSKRKTISLVPDGNDIIIKSEPPTWYRVARITGYLSKIDNFNGAKKKEYEDRTTHMSIDQLAIRG